MLRRHQLQQIERLLFRQRRQQGVLLLAARRQHAAIAVELQNFALSLEQAVGRLHLHVGDGKNRRRHLAGQEAVVNQRVQPQLILRQMLGHLLGSVRQVGRPDRLVSFLRAFAGGVAVGLFGKVRLTELVTDVFPARLHGVVGHARAVGTHVGNEPDRSFIAQLHAFIEPLG